MPVTGQGGKIMQEELSEKKGAENPKTKPVYRNFNVNVLANDNTAIELAQALVVVLSNYMDMNKADMRDTLKFVSNMSHYSSN